MGRHPRTRPSIVRAKQLLTASGVEDRVAFDCQDAAPHRLRLNGSWDWCTWGDGAGGFRRRFRTCRQLGYLNPAHRHRGVDDGRRAT